MVHGQQEQPSRAQNAPELDVHVVPELTSEGEYLKPLLESEEEVISCELPVEGDKSKDSITLKDNDQSECMEEIFSDSLELTQLNPKRTLKDYLMVKMETIVHTYDMEGKRILLQMLKIRIQLQIPRKFGGQIVNVDIKLYLPRLHQKSL